MNLSMPPAEQLDRLLAESGRHAVLSHELSGPRSAVYRALRRRCVDGTLARIGRGVYARKRARLFDVVPEILPKLGYKILPSPPVRNWSFKSGGNVWRIDRPCTRLILKHGVRAVFESPQGKLYKHGKVRPMPSNRLPTPMEVERSIGMVDRCHSYARAEKHLIVEQALRAWESFEHPGATLALEGGTCLTVYHELTRRYSEDLDIRVILTDELEDGPSARRGAAFRAVSAAFAKHVHREIPYLETTRKGRFRKRDGRFESHIFRYRGRQPHDKVPQGLKLELVQKRTRLPLIWEVGKIRSEVPLVHHSEIAAGKWQALCTRLAGRRHSSPDYVRHPADLVTIRRALEPAVIEPLTRELRGPAVAQALRELHDPLWAAHYEDYLDRMGTMPIIDGQAFGYMSWPVALRRIAHIALTLELVSRADRAEVRRMAGLSPRSHTRR